MFKILALLSFVSIGLMVWCLVEAISADERRVRALAKPWWILLILLLPLAGAIAWLVAGRPVVGGPRPGAAPVHPEHDRPRRMGAGDPVKGEDFLKKVRRRAEDQRRRYEAQEDEKDKDIEQPEPE